MSLRIRQANIKEEPARRLEQPVPGMRILAGILGNAAARHTHQIGNSMFQGYRFWAKSWIPRRQIQIVTKKGWNQIEAFICHLRQRRPCAINFATNGLPTSLHLLETTSSTAKCERTVANKLLASFLTKNCSTRIICITNNSIWNFKSRPCWKMSEWMAVCWTKENLMICLNLAAMKSSSPKRSCNLTIGARRLKRRVAKQKTTVAVNMNCSPTAEAPLYKLVRKHSIISTPFLTKIPFIIFQ